MKKILLILPLLFFFINVNASSYTITSVNLSDSSSVNNSTLFSNGNVYTTGSSSFYGFTYWSMPTAQGQLAESTYLITKVCSSNPITEEPYSSYSSNIFREVLTDNINCSVGGLAGKYYYLGGGSVLYGSGNGTYETGYFGAKYNAPSGTKLIYINSIAYDSNEYVNFKNGLDSISLNSNQCSNLFNVNPNFTSKNGLTFSNKNGNISITGTPTSSGHYNYSYIGTFQPGTYYFKSTGSCNNVSWYVWNQTLSQASDIGSATITLSSESLLSLTAYIHGDSSTNCNVKLSFFKNEDKPFCEYGSLSNPTNDLKDSITDDSVSDPDSFITQFTNMLATNGTITQLITLPITMFTTILNNVNGTCTSFNVGSLLGTDLIFPCIDVSTYLGSTLWGIIDVICSGFFVLTIAKKMIKAFNNFSGMKEGDVINND